MNNKQANNQKAMNRLQNAAIGLLLGVAFGAGVGITSAAHGDTLDWSATEATALENCYNVKDADDKRHCVWNKYQDHNIRQLDRNERRMNDYDEAMAGMAEMFVDRY